jgi:hypothetical protein
MTNDQTPSRRAHLLASAAALVAAGLLACGGNSTPAGTPAATGSAASTAASAASTEPASASSSSGGTSSTTLAVGDGDKGGDKLPAADAGAAKGPHTAEPGRSRDDIQARVQARRDEARACYDEGVKKHPGIEGDLVIRWVIDPKGEVTGAEVDTMKSQIMEPSVGECVVAIIKKLKFPESAKGFETKASYPFNFRARPASPKK